MVKYKCLDCGHVFKGEKYSTTECPKCGSNNIRENKGVEPGMLKKILIGVGAVIVLLLLLKGCPSDIKVSMTENAEAQMLVFTVDGVSKSDLKANYTIVVYNQNSSEIDRLFFNGKSESTQYSIEQLTANECYTFNLVKKTGGDIKFKWTTDNQYCMPAPPEPPTIVCNKIPDCKTGTYTIKVNTISGSIAEYYIDDNGQASSEFSNVMPRNQPYKVKARDVNGLMSVEQSVYCTASGVQSFHITESGIQAEFDKVSEGNEYVGDAMAKISQGINIKLATSIDGCAYLEEVLNYACNMEQRYKIKAVIENNGCSDRITSLTITHK